MGSEAADRLPLAGHRRARRRIASTAIAAHASSQSVGSLGRDDAATSEQPPAPTLVISTGAAAMLAPTESACDIPGVSVTNVSVSARSPGVAALAGSGATSKTQLCPGASVIGSAPHRAVPTKSPDAKRSAVTRICVVPELVTVTEIGSTCAPATRLGKLTEGGVTVSAYCAAITPLPLSARGAGADPLATTLNVAARGPAPAGANATLTVQLLPLASVVPAAQVPPTTNSALLAPSEVKVAVPGPWLTSVSDAGAEVAPTAVSAKAAVPAHASTGTDESEPVPASATAAVAGTAFELTVSCPVYVVAAAGANVTTMLQEVAAATLLPQLCAAANPAPVTPIDAMLRTALPLLVKVTVRDSAAAPTAAVPKSCAVGASVIAGAAAATPVPFRPTVAAGAFEASARLAGRAASAVGAKRTESEQVWPAGIDRPGAHVPARA